MTDVLSADSIRRAIEKLKSPEYEAFIREKDERQSASWHLVGEALRRKIITNDEALRYSAMISLNGFLILHPNDKHIKDFEALSEKMDEEKKP